jgi:N-acetylmuramoyl-L-alanine amidase
MELVMWHVVKQGECLSSIAAENGMFWQTLWDLPENAEFKAKRKNPNVLYPGDRIWIPEKEEKREAGATAQRHAFRLKGTPATIRLRLITRDLKPRPELDYLLVIDGDSFQGTTDGEGMIEHRIKPDAKKGVLTVYTKSRTEKYQLRLGDIDPHDTETGVGQRLTNLGVGPIGGPLVAGKVGEDDEAFARAIKLFQKQTALPVSGRIDPATRDKLEEISGL